MLFLGTLLFALFYIPHVFSPEDPMLPVKAKAPLPENTATSAFLASTALERGESIFLAKCAVCHGKLGKGGIGPNLTDSHWVHGSRPEDILKVIAEGVPNQGMVAWKTILSPQAMGEVRDYILTLAETPPPVP